MKLVHVDNLIKNYNTKAGIVNAVKGVNLECDKFGLICILGKSGCGKSTLLNLIATIQNFDSGEIYLEGNAVSNMTSAEKSFYRNTFFSIVLQDSNLFFDFTIYQNIDLILQLQGKTKNKEKIQKVLCDVDLAGFEKRKANKLSGGQQQRVAIACALAKDAKVILADEPTGNLDEQTAEDILKLLKAVSKDKLVIIVTHDSELASKYADRIIRMSDGKIVENEEQAYEN